MPSYNRHGWLFCFLIWVVLKMWVHFTIEESYILGNTIFDLVKMETVRPVDKFICLLIMFLSNLNVTSVPHFLPRKYIFDIYTVCYRIQSFILFENKCIIRKRRYNFTLDETGAYYTEWSKPERKTPIQYTNAYTWNLERW